MGKLYLRQHRYSEAEPLYRRALSIQENNPGLHHPDVVSTLMGYALLLNKTRRKSEASAMIVRAQEILTKNAVELSTDHTVDIQALDPRRKSRLTGNTKPD